jgi:hypothetical protein
MARWIGLFAGAWLALTGCGGGEGTPDAAPDPGGEEAVQDGGNGDAPYEDEAAAPDEAGDEIAIDPVADEAGPEAIDPGPEADVEVVADTAEPGPEAIGTEVPVWPCEGPADCVLAFPGAGPCEATLCDPGAGVCVLRPRDDGTACDDSNSCTADDRCTAGRCKGRTFPCDDGNPCTDDGCSPATGCFHNFNTVPCDDGNPCTDKEACKSGACTGGVNHCACGGVEDCLAFQDADACNGTIDCVGGFCVVAASTAVACDAAGDTACELSACDAVTGSCGTVRAPEGRPCDDLDACTVGETCHAGNCGGGQPRPCDDGNPCTADSCDAKAGCLHVPADAACDDGEPCSATSECRYGLCVPADLAACPAACRIAGDLFCGDSLHGDSGGPDSTSLVQSYGCTSPGTKHTGPEVAYAFVPPWDGRFTVTLGDKTGDVDVLVLEGGNGCDPARCVAWGTGEAEFEGNAFHPYLVVIDGYAGAEGEFNVHASCTPGHETDCDDGLDEDEDGKADCEDAEDCGEAPTCPHPGCVPAWELACGGSDTWATWYPGSTKQLKAYSCNGTDYGGREYAYAFHATATGNVTARLRGESSNTALVVLKDAQGKCQSNTCIEFGSTEATFDAIAGTTYYLVVDGIKGAQGKYTLEVACQ